MPEHTGPVLAVVTLSQIFRLFCYNFQCQSLPVRYWLQLPLQIYPLLNRVPEHTGPVLAVVTLSQIFPLFCYQFRCWSCLTKQIYTGCHSLSVQSRLHFFYYFVTNSHHSGAGYVTKYQHTLGIRALLVRYWLQLPYHIKNFSNYYVTNSHRFGTGHVTTHKIHWVPQFFLLQNRIYLFNLQFSHYLVITSRQSGTGHVKRHGHKRVLEPTSPVLATVTPPYIARILTECLLTTGLMLVM